MRRDVGALRTIITDLMNDRGKRMLLRSLPFAGLIAVVVILQPEYVGFLEKIRVFLLVLALAALLLPAVLIIPRLLMAVSRASQEKLPLSEFIKTKAYEEMRDEWRA